MTTRLVVGKEALAVLRHLHPETKKRMRDALRALKASWPRPNQLDVAKLRSDVASPPVFRLRVGDWRVVFRAPGEVLEFVRVFHRSEGYGWMERE